MKLTTRFSAFVAIAICATATAETTVLAPDEGSVTNVVQIFSGDTALEIAGPGTAVLNPANSHIGGTTLSGGTLAIYGGATSGANSPVGSGALAITGGTLRGSGVFTHDIAASAAATLAGDDTLTLAGNNSFAEAVSITDGTIEIASGTTQFAKQFFLAPSGSSPAAYMQSGGTVTLGAGNLQLSYVSGSTSSFTMTGGSFDANGKNVVAGYSVANSTATLDISGPAVFSNVYNLYTYQRKNNSLTVSVHDGGTLNVNSGLYAGAASGTTLSVAATSGGYVSVGGQLHTKGSGSVVNLVVDGGTLQTPGIIAAKDNGSVGSALTASVLNGGVLAAPAISAEANSTTELTIDGGIIRNNSTTNTTDNYFNYFTQNAPITVKIGPGGATFRDGGTTTKYAQLYREMVATGEGEANGVTFDGGNWAYYTAQSYAGPTVIKNGATLFLAGAGYIPANSTVVVGEGSQLRIGNTDKPVTSLVLGEGAKLGFANTTKQIKVSESLTLPTAANIVLYSANTPTEETKNSNGSYTVLSAPAAYADALSAVRWSYGAATATKIYTFSVGVSGSTATLTLTIANAPDTTGDISIGAGQNLAISGSLDVGSRSIVVDGGSLSIGTSLTGTAAGGKVVVKNSGFLDVANYVRFSSAANGRYDLYLLDGGKLRTQLINPVANYSENVEHALHIDGGVLYPVATTSDTMSYFPRYTSAYVGAGGAIIDLSQWANNGASGWYRFSCQQTFDHDPDCAGADGGIVIRGNPGDTVLYYLTSAFAPSTLTGTITVEAGGAISVAATALSGHTLAVLPGGRFKVYANTVSAAAENVVLGAAGATDPVLLEVASDATGPAIVVDGALDIRSPVSISPYVGGWNYDSIPTACVNTTLVYRAENSSVDPSLFVAPANAGNLGLSAEIVNITEGAYAGYSAVVVTLSQSFDKSLAVRDGASATVSAGDSATYDNIYVGDFGAVADHKLSVSGGETSAGTLYLGYMPGAGTSIEDGLHTDVYEQTDGTVRVDEIRSHYAASNSEATAGRADTEINISGGSLDVSGNVLLGYNRMYSGRTSKISVSGGRLSVGGYMQLIRYSGTVFTAAGILEISGGEVDVAGTVDLSCTTNQAASTVNGGIWLKGGKLEAENVIQTIDYCPTAFVYFDGGVYAPYGTSAANRTMQGLNKAYVSAGGAVVSTENLPLGATYTIAQDLLTDPALDGETDGGLVKKGSGVLALSGANNYTGRTVVEAGTLAATNTGAISDSVTVANGALLSASGLDLALAKIASSGVIAARTLSVSDAIELTADGSILSVNGDLTLVRGMAIDFGAFDETPVGRVAVASVSGTVSVPDFIRARNAGGDTRCQIDVEDGIVYANPTSTGFVLIIR